MTMDEPMMSAAMISASDSRLAARSIWLPTRLSDWISRPMFMRPMRALRSRRERSCGSCSVSSSMRTQEPQARLAMVLG